MKSGLAAPAGVGVDRLSGTAGGAARRVIFANVFDRSWPVSSCQTDLSTDPEY